MYIKILNLLQIALNCKIKINILPLNKNINTFLDPHRRKICRLHFLKLILVAVDALISFFVIYIVHLC